ncbi:hypothetical protein B0I24_10742 [Aliidiomarina maris]|uniref:Uncharacterized protein n=1 Tax=Aliidiomarina maris TaxID=531312 RepID=A0A327WUY1_9GAMM|nr:hypothetical protein B0I24_10742 [Aliidiomarina maris]
MFFPSPLLVFYPRPYFRLFLATQYNEVAYKIRAEKQKKGAE